MWEDRLNSKGGRLTISTSKATLDGVFTNCVMALVGSVLEIDALPTQASNGVICGVVASRRARGVRLVSLFHQLAVLALICANSRTESRSGSEERMRRTRTGSSASRLSSRGSLTCPRSRPAGTRSTTLSCCMRWVKKEEPSRGSAAAVSASALFFSRFFAFSIPMSVLCGRSGQIEHEKRRARLSETRRYHLRVEARPLGRKAVKNKDIMKDLSS